VIRTLALHPSHMMCAIVLSAEPLLAVGCEQSGQSNVSATSDKFSAKPISIPFVSALAIPFKAAVCATAMKPLTQRDQRNSLHRAQRQPMTDKPVTTYIVSVFEAPHWRTVLTTKDKAKALVMARSRRR
jgi:hypothetical protein